MSQKFNGLEAKTQLKVFHVETKYNTAAERSCYDTEPDC